MDLKDCLEETCGILLYQEQALEIPHRVANFSYVDADELYQLLTHPQGSEEELLAYQERFLSGAIDNGIDHDTALTMWRNLTQIAGYSFPKGHATAYAGLAYEALRLKHYYPVEYLCALLNHQPCGSYPVRVLVMEARHLGIGLTPLDINASVIKWTVEQGNLRIGLSQLKGMTDSSLRRILLARKERRFASLEDFVARTWLPGYLIENLVLVGALESLEGDRSQTLEELSVILRRRKKGGRNTLGFPGARSSVSIQTTSCRRDKMIWEFGLLGFCSTATPYDLLRDEISELVPQIGRASCRERV
jgi:DNA polymerase III alpha subunit